jgi:hypothetical protein
MAGAFDDVGEWPELPYEGWKATYRTLHMDTQIIGKLRLALAPKWNQCWQVPFYTTARGLTTSPMPYGFRTLEIRFDFIDHQLLFETSDGRRRTLPLEPRTVADFYDEVFGILGALGVDVHIWPQPVEVEGGIPFLEDDVDRAYDRDAVRRFWTITRELDLLFKEFRGRFRGKCSPVHFFWGSFDMAVTRFSGRMAPERPAADPITAEAYDEEVSSLGFWPGDAETGGPVIYSYTAPEPPGFATAEVRPAAARYDDRLKEFVLPYDALRAAADRRALVLDFAESTYQAGARAAGWDVTALAYRRGEAAQQRPAPAVAQGAQARPSPQ